MAGSTVNISFNKDLLAEIDKTAKQESRTRSDLIGEAARLCIGRKNRWERIFAFGSRQAHRFHFGAGVREEAAGNPGLGRSPEFELIKRIGS